MEPSGIQGGKGLSVFLLLMAGRFEVEADGGVPDFCVAVLPMVRFTAPSLARRSCHLFTIFGGGVGTVAGNVGTGGWYTSFSLRSVPGKNSTEVGISKVEGTPGNVNILRTEQKDLIRIESMDIILNPADVSASSSGRSMIRLVHFTNGSEFRGS